MEIAARREMRNQAALTIFCLRNMLYRDGYKTLFRSEVK